jgi:small subunit ribosomal protein S15
MSEEKQTENDSWSKIKPKDLENQIVELAKTGESPAKIGLILRDQHGIPKVKTITGKKIKQILEERKVAYKTEKTIVTENVEKIKTHLKNNRKDHPASRSLTKKLWALKKYP